MKQFPQDITPRDKYGPAMELIDQNECDIYFERCVQHGMSRDKSREQAEKTERSNLGYYAGYYSSDVRARVERMFRCAHPIFGVIENGPPTAEQAFETSMKLREAKNS